MVGTSIVSSVALAGSGSHITKSSPTSYRSPSQSRTAFGRIINPHVKHYFLRFSAQRQVLIPETTSQRDLFSGSEAIDGGDPDCWTYAPPSISWSPSASRRRRWRSPSASRRRRRRIESAPADLLVSSGEETTAATEALFVEGHESFLVSSTDPLSTGAP